MDEKKLGFGCMRLPIQNAENQRSIDGDQLNRMVDVFLERGFTYFDTAYMYHDFYSEIAMREALVKRYPRAAFTLADKLPMRDLSDESDQERIFGEQLEKCGVDYFDNYLLHNIVSHTYQKALQYDSFAFAMKKKAEGRIRRFGISFHGTPQLLDEILSAHDEIEFVQLQINYIDWENPGIRARECYAIARRHGKPVTVMEPVKGGTLALLPAAALAVLNAACPGASAASLAVRFAAGLEGVTTVLSGMSSIGQLLDNTGYMQEFVPLSASELAVVDEITKILGGIKAVPCTACRYCETHCPQKIAIPEYFSLLNSVKRATAAGFSSQACYYAEIASHRGRAGDCLACGNCERACPQHIEIIAALKEVSALFDHTMFMKK